MVPPSNKRKAPPTTGPDLKRSKGLPKPGAGARAKASQAKKSKTNSKPRAAPAGRAVFDASVLGWESVGDEAFGGLQVLSGVDVVRDGEKVQFIVKGDATEAARVAAESRAEGDSVQDVGEDHVEAQGLDSGPVGAAEAGVAAERAEEKAALAGAESDGAAGARDGDGQRKQKKQKKKQPRNRNKKDENDGKGKAGKTSKEGVVVKTDPAGETDTAGKRCKPQKIGDQKVPKSGSHGLGNEFSALAEMEDDGAGDNDLDMAAWVALNLSPSLVAAIAKLGFSKPTAIQQKSIPEIVAGEDVIGKAQTGSGKTLAFGIPIVERWLEMHESQMDVDVDVDVDVDMDGDLDLDEDEDEDEDPSRTTATTAKQEEEKGEKKKKMKEPKAPLAVILSPTRELAKQIGDHIKAVCNGLPASPYVCVVTGGLSIQKQQRQLEKADIVIGTPGRLWEVLDGDASLQKQFRKMQFLVIDEADRLFKAGQFKEAENIIGALDRRAPGDEFTEGSEHSDSDADSDAGRDGATSGGKKRQTLVFSATFDKDLQTKLAGKARSSKPGGGQDEKMEYLMKCLRFRGPPKFIDVNPAGRMADNLREGLIECGAMEK
ncbi:hypothetical protein E4U41_001449, partial [Claviceps citrina]